MCFFAIKKCDKINDIISISIYSVDPETGAVSDLDSE